MQTYWDWWTHYTAPELYEWVNAYKIVMYSIKSKFSIKFLTLSYFQNMIVIFLMMLIRKSGGEVNYNLDFLGFIGKSTHPIKKKGLFGWCIAKKCLHAMDVLKKRNFL